MDANSLFAPDDTPAPSATGWALCEFASLGLVISQQDILSIEQADELSVALPGETVAGWFTGAQGPWPVYALNRYLQPDRNGARGSFIVFIRSAPQPIGLLCEAVRIISQQQSLSLHAVPVPLCYSPAFTNITAIARLSKERLAYAIEQGQAEQFMVQQLQALRSATFSANSNREVA